MSTDSTSAVYWAEHALLSDGVAHGVRITVEAGRITAVQVETAACAGDIVLRGLVVPGAANCHSHAFQRCLRGLGAAGATFWSWRDTMYRAAANLTPELYYPLARALYTEMLCAGYTSVAEFHYVHHRPDGRPYDDPNAMGEALIRAAHDVGIRLTLLDTCYLHADVDGAAPQPHQLRFCDGAAAAWAERMDALEELAAPYADAAIVGAAVHSVRACQPDEAACVADWARKHGRPVHVHLSEQVVENEACLAHTGVTPAALLASVGFWGPDVHAVHATHLTSDDIAILARSGASVVFCPTTEADLADGIGPARALVEAGVPLQIGSDENVSIDPFEEIRCLDRHERLASGQRDGLAPSTLLSTLFTDGQAACGWHDAGAIETGKLADLVALDTASVRTAGALLDSVPLVVSASDVTDVVVSGKHVVSGGQSARPFDATELSHAVAVLRGEK